MSTASPRLLSRSKVVIDRVHLVDIRCGCIFVGLCETHSWPAWRTAQAGISSLKISRGSGRGGGSRVEGWRDSCGPRCDNRDARKGHQALAFSRQWVLQKVRKVRVFLFHYLQKDHEYSLQISFL